MNEMKPPERLAPFVEAFWSARFNARALSLLAQHVVPSGFVELIIHVSDEHCRLNRHGLWSSTPDHIIIGLYTSPYEVRFAEPVDVFGVRFKPEAIYNVFGIPASEFHEQYEDMELVLGPSFRDFCVRLRDRSTDSARTRAVEEYLSAQLARHHPHVSYVNHAAEMIRASGGFLRVEDLCGRVFISLRQLEREFKQRVGITPKTYTRLARLNSVLRAMDANGSVDLTQIAFHCGYADQAHFIRDFRSLTGTPPRVFTRNQREYIVNLPAD